MEEPLSLETRIEQQQPSQPSRLFKMLNWATGTALEDVISVVRDGLGYGAVKGNEWKQAAKKAVKNTVVAATSWYLLLPWYVATHEAMHVMGRKILNGRRAGIAAVEIDTGLMPHGRLIQYAFPFIETLKGGSENAGQVTPTFHRMDIGAQAVFSLMPYALSVAGIPILKKGIKDRNPVLIGTSLSYALCQFYQAAVNGDPANLAIGGLYTITHHAPTVAEYDYYVIGGTIGGALLASALYGGSKVIVKGVEYVGDKMRSAKRKMAGTRSTAKSVLAALGAYAVIGLATIPFSKPDRPQWKTERGLENLCMHLYTTWRNDDERAYQEALIGLSTYEDRHGRLCERAGEAGARLMLKNELSPEQYRTDLEPHVGREAVDKVLGDLETAQRNEEERRENFRNNYPDSPMPTDVFNYRFAIDGGDAFHAACREASTPEWAREK